MAKDPAFLFYYQDFAYGTRKLTFEEKGAYIELLCEQADIGPLTLDDIKRALNSHFPIWDRICSKFTVDKDGRFFNERLAECIEKRKKYVFSRKNNLLSSHMDKHMDTHMQTHMGNRNRNRNEKENIKEKKTFNHKKEAVEVYEHYSANIKSGAREDAIRNISKLLESGLSKDDLIKRIDGYKQSIQKDGRNDKQYYIQANNFFGRSARFKEFAPYEPKYNPVDPNCSICKGTGFIYVQALSANKICSCRQKP